MIRTIKKVLLILIGVTVMGLGTAMCRQTGLGVDPYNALCIAVARITNLALGNVTLFGNLLLLLVVLVTARKYVGIGTLVPMVCFGYLLQFFSQVLSPITELNWFSRLSVFSVGVLLISFGMALYMGSNLGMVAYDAIAYILHDQINHPSFVLRVGLDFSVAVIAYLTGGPISVGTVILVLGIGPLIAYFRRHPVAKIYRYLI